jgi:CHAD domain-containing protein
MSEVELKLQVHGPLEFPDFRQVEGIAEVTELPSQNLRATYYDTSDLRLARNGITLRYRTGESENGVWTLKLPFEHRLFAREELNYDGTPSSIPQDAQRLVTAFTRSARLQTVTRIQTRRRRWHLKGVEGDPVAELVDDEVSVREGHRVAVRWREVEVEALSDSTEPIEKTSALLQEAGAVAGGAIPKAVRALGSRASAPPDVVPPSPIDPAEPAGHAVGAALAAGTYRLITNDPLTRIGDEEGVHQTRVAARRMRSDLRTFAPLVDEEWAASLSNSLKWIANALGEVRDLDVMQARLRKAGGGMEDDLDPLFRLMDLRHSTSRSALMEALASSRYTSLLDRLVQAVHQPQLTATARQPCSDVLPALVEAAWMRLARRARSLRPGDPDEDFHRVRILAKRARYAAEAVAPSLGPKIGKRAKRFACRCADVQDDLGLLQDAVVSAGMVRHLAEQHTNDGSLNLALGRLLERQELNQREAKQNFFKVWSRLDKPKNLKWLES